MNRLARNASVWAVKAAYILSGTTMNAMIAIFVEPERVGITLALCLQITGLLVYEHIFNGNKNETTV